MPIPAIAVSGPMRVGRASWARPARRARTRGLAENTSLLAAGDPCERALGRSAVQALLEGARSREFGGLGGRDVDRLACRGVASLPGSALADAELAEARQRDLAPAGQLVGDHLDRRLNHLARLAGGDPCALGDLLG